MLDIDLPEPFMFLVGAGVVALALYNIGRLARVLRIPELGRWIAGVMWMAFGPVVTAALKVIVRDAVQEETRAILEELRPNGGTSLRDAVDRMEVKLDDHLEWSQRVMSVNELEEPDR